MRAKLREKLFHHHACAARSLGQAPKLALQPILSGSDRNRLQKVDGDWRFLERRECIGETGNLSAHLLQSFDEPTGD